MALFNGQELTVTHLRDLLDQAGWKLSAVHYDRLSAVNYRKAIAIPK